MEISLVTITVDRHTGETISREVKETKEVDEDQFYRPLVEVLGDEFLKHWRSRSW